MRLSLSGTIGGASDEIAVEVPVRPWGIEAVASQSGTSSESTTVFVGLPPGRTYASPEMLIVVSPSLERMIIEMAVGEDAYPVLRNASANAARRICYPPPFTTADRAAELLAATSALQYLRSTRAAGAALEAQRLSQRVQSLVAAIVSSQNHDGGWAWVSAESTPRLGQNAPALRRVTAWRRLPLSGACLGRAAGVAHRREGTRPGCRVLERRIRQAFRKRSRDSRGALARAQHAAGRQHSSRPIV